VNEIESAYMLIGELYMLSAYTLIGELYMLSAYRLISDCIC